jgi:D-lactate dehydrogenase
MRSVLAAAQTWGGRAPSDDNVYLYCGSTASSNPAAIRRLKSGRPDSTGLDDCEEEADLFFQNLSGRIIPHDVLTHLLNFPNVLITGHQAFFTEEAPTVIAEAAITNVTDF